MKRLKTFLYYFLPCLFVVLGITTVFSESIWYDETSTLALVYNSFPEVIRLVSIDVHPPLYYLMLKLCVMLLGGILDYITIGKILAFIPLISLLVIGFTSIKKRYGEVVSFLFNIFVVGMPHMLTYFTEIRMYGWGMLFVTCAFLVVPKIVKGEENVLKNYILLTLFAALASYMHYFACLSSIVVYLELILVFIFTKRYKEIGKVFLSGLLVVATYLPWLSVFFIQISSVKEGFWIAPLTIVNINEAIVFPFEATPMVTTLIVLVVIAGLLGMLKLDSHKKLLAVCATGVWILTVAFGIILSYLITPVFCPRYSFCSLGCLWFGISLGLSEIKKFRINETILEVIVVAISSLMVVSFVIVEYSYEKDTNNTLNELNGIMDDDALILCGYDQLHGITAYFLPDYLNVVFDYDISIFYKGNDTSYQYMSIDSLDNLSEFEGREVIVLDSVTEGFPMEYILNVSGYNLDYLGYYSIDRYNFNAYAINWGEQ